MKLHVSAGVKNLDDGVIFYTKIFGIPPTKLKEDYAQWELKQVNFSISDRDTYTEGIDHMGFDIEDEKGLEVFRKRFADENVKTFDEDQTTCCYRESDKLWAEHDNVKWEIFYSTADSETFYSEGETNCCDEKTTCC